ncbi:hypothetical protein IWX49DRAFT_640762, partial [Phyllosticta citricarpa]
FQTLIYPFFPKSFFFVPQPRHPKSPTLLLFLCARSASSKGAASPGIPKSSESLCRPVAFFLSPTMAEKEDIRSERSPSPPLLSLPSRSSSWPLTQSGRRMSPHRYNLRRRPGQIPSTVVSDNGSTAVSTSTTSTTSSPYQSFEGFHVDHVPRTMPPTRRRKQPATRNRTDKTAVNPGYIETVELPYAATPTRQQRPSRLQVLLRFLGRSAFIVAIFCAGIAVGYYLMWHAAGARGGEGAATTATPADRQAKQQYLAERLGADLQMLHWNPLTALGVVARPESDASVEEVEQCKRAVGKGYRAMSGVWHPDSCPYRKQGIIAGWQCSELYQMLERKKKRALYHCLNGEMRRAANMRSMWGSDE